jgi:KUP system potassium uptake protein
MLFGTPRWSGPGHRRGGRGTIRPMETLLIIHLALQRGASLATTATVGEATSAAARGHGDLRALALAALGVVYGDIGTSPLYTMREAFGHAGGLHLSEPAVLGVLSLVFWSLILVVTVKYVVLILRADNRGEGGVLALGTLASRAVPRTPALCWLIPALTIAGLALFYGDGLITPAISVLSAVEGLKTAAPALEPYVVPVAACVLLGLFLIQRRGTARVGALFGPVMLAWFVTLGLLGLAQIVQNPAVLAALDPRYALGLFGHAGWQAFVALGAIVLAVTGAEALYADMGHFGRAPIRLAWLGLVLPGLVLNYFGQGALVLRDPAALEHPFYHLVPGWALWPLIGLATCATIIASQAVISGVFSLTRQAIQLGYLPRMRVKHTSATEIGQIYIPRVNWLLMAGVLLLVFGFRSSGNLAAAYGISVMGAMAIDAVLAGLIAAWRWRWGPAAAVVFGGFLVIDLAYFAANALKIPSGGWFPLVVAAAFAYLVVTWRRGRAVLWDKLYGRQPAVPAFIAGLDPGLIRVRGTAVYMTGNPEAVPTALLHNLEHNQVLHEQAVLMTVRIQDIPHVPDGRRLEVGRLDAGFFRVVVSYGFMDRPDVPRALELCQARGLRADPARISYFIGRETLIPTPRPPMGPVEARVFTFLSAGSLAATAYFQIPPERVVELGTQLEI